DRVLEVGDFSARLDLDRSRQVTLGDAGGDLGDGTDLIREVGREQIYVAREVLPRAGCARHVRLAAEPALDADLARDVRHLFGERRERVGHVVDRLGERGDLALGFDREPLPQIAGGHSSHDFHDAADLVSQVGGHDVDRVGQVLPGAGNIWNFRLAAKLAFGADLARDARDFRGERAQLVDHRVDGVLELENLALDVDRNLAREVAARDRRRDFGDVSHLGREVAGHRVDGVGEVLPRAADAGHRGLPAELAFGADFAGDARDFGGERPQLFDHRVDGLLQLQNLAANVDRDLAGQVAGGHGDRDIRDVADLSREIAGHLIDVVGEVLPRTGDAGDDGLAAEFALGANLARDAGHFRGERVELVHHRIDGVLELEDLALDVDRDLAGQVAVRNRGRDVRDVADLAREVRRHRVHIVGEVLPRAGDAWHRGLAAEFPVGSHFARDAAHFRGEGIELVHHRVDGVLEREDFAFDVDRDLARQVAARDGRGDLGDVAHLTGEVRRHRVDVVGEVLPGAGDTGDVGLAAQLAVTADFARDARDFGRERIELVHHRVDGVLELEDFAFDVDRDLAREIPVRDRGRDLRDVSDLAGQVRGHRVDVVGEVLPGAGDARHVRLAAQLALGADFARDARDFRGERVELVHHRVAGVLELEDPALDVDRDLPRQVAVRDGDGHVRDVAHLIRQVRGHRVDVVGEILPRAGDAGHNRLAAELAVGADLARDARDFRRECVELVHHRVDGVLE